MESQLAYAVFETEGGWVGVLGSAAGLRRVTAFGTSEKDALVSLGLSNRALPPKGDYTDLARRFQSYFQGKRVDFPDKLDLSEGTAFQRKVWEAARKIPYGQTHSYGWLAQQIGQPQAARAVGQAIGKNPLTIVVPCHRVIAGDGTIGGFTGGVKYKKRLLALEKISYQE
jgi:methylated-DNA-[protein]-cysteine S-methyltransferase